MDLKDRVTKAATEGSYAAAASQAAKRLRQLLVFTVRKKDEQLANNMELFLETDVGAALIQAVLGFGCLYAPLPQIKNNPMAEKFGNKLLEKSVENSINFGVDIAMESLVPILTEMLSAVPNENFLRVEELPQGTQHHVEDSAEVHHKQRASR